MTSASDGYTGRRVRLETEPPPGYVPLEMPELWHPPVASESSVAPSRAPADGLAQPAAGLGPSTARTPRSFGELKTGVLADRQFASMQQLAVAAVREAGWDPVAIAPLFRVPVWRLQSWVDAATDSPGSAPPRTWRPGQR